MVYSSPHSAIALNPGKQESIFQIGGGYEGCNSGQGASKGAASPNHLKCECSARFVIDIYQSAHWTGGFAPCGVRISGNSKPTAGTGKDPSTTPKTIPVSSHVACQEGCQVGHGNRRATFKPSWGSYESPGLTQSRENGRERSGILAGMGSDHPKKHIWTKRPLFHCSL